MTCKYYLKGKQFNSELALDEYLINIEKFYKQLGDEVFQLGTPTQVSRRQTLLGLDERKNELYRQGKVKREVTSTEFGDSNVKVEAPYIGVSKFLGQYVKKDKTPLFESFEGDDFWKEIRKKWSKPEFWKNEATLDEIKEVFGPNATEGRAITDQSEFNQIRERFEE